MKTISLWGDRQGANQTASRRFSTRCCFFVTMLLVLASSTGCESLFGVNTYQSPTSGYQHSYVTSTQQSHRLTGVRFKQSGGDIMTAVFGLGLDHVSYWIDGRLVFKSSWARTAESLVQLPPGEHELTFRGNSKPVSVRFYLAEGEIKEFEGRVDNFQRWAPTEETKRQFNIPEDWAK